MAASLPLRLPQPAVTSPRAGRQASQRLPHLLLAHTFSSGGGSRLLPQPHSSPCLAPVLGLRILQNLPAQSMRRPSCQMRVPPTGPCSSHRGRSVALNSCHQTPCRGLKPLGTGPGPDGMRDRPGCRWRCAASQGPRAELSPLPPPT